MSSSSHSSNSAVLYTDRQRREAADWFPVIHETDDPNAETLQAWLQWMEASEGNRRAFEAVAQTWHETPTSLIAMMPSARELAEDTYDGATPFAQWLTADPQSNRTGNVTSGSDGTSFRGGGRIRAGTRIRGGRRIGWGLALAASVAIIVLGALPVIRLLKPTGPASGVFVTRTGEQRHIVLADGSSVWLGAKSQLVVAITKERRDFELKTGEAYFAVKKDGSRPFTVHTLTGDITALGTAFDVRTMNDRITVAVAEGTVRVRAIRDPTLADAAPSDVRVESGQQLSFDTHRSARLPALAANTDPRERARWREGVLVYHDETLGEVVADISRYTDRTLEVKDESIAKLRFSGVVYQKAIDEWASALPESFPVKIILEGSRLTIEAR